MAEDSVIGAFSEGDAATLSGLSLHQLRAWDRDGFFAPSYGSAGRGVPFSRIYSFRDIVSLRVLNELRNKAGFSLQYLKKLSDKLAPLGDVKWTATILYVLGKTVVVSYPGSRRREDPVTGQQVFDIPLRLVIASTKEAINRLNDRSASVGIITRSKFVNQNDLVFEGTRVRVTSVTEMLEAGYDDARIIRLYPDLKLEDVLAARNYQIERHAA